MSSTLETGNQLEKPTDTRATQAMDVAGDFKVYLKKEGRFLDDYAFDTEAVSESDIAEEFGLSEAIAVGLKHYDLEISEEAKKLILQGKTKEAQALCEKQVEEDAQQTSLVVSDTRNITQFFEGLIYHNDLLTSGTFSSLRKLSKGGKEVVFDMFNQSFQGEPTHNEVADNRVDDKLSNHDVYVMTPTDKTALRAKIAEIGLSAKYRIIEGQDPQVFILQIHNKNIPFICAEYGTK